MLGYKEIIPGSRVTFSGVVEPKIVFGKVIQVVMHDPQMKVVGYKWNIRLVLGQWRAGWIEKLQRNLPEPMASLAGGILLGIKGQMPQDFYQALVNTGTLHIIAASGYNVSIVAEVLMKMLGGLASRGAGVMIGVLGIFIYVLISGGGASVVRAGLMGSLTLIAYYFGRPAEARRLLWVTGAIMLLVQPLMLLDVGFQLSFMATAGLLYLEPITRKLPQHKFLKEYLYPTLSASVATLPIILWYFGRVSWISPLVNILVLPIVPLIMGMTAGVLLGGQVVAWFTYPLLAYMVWVIRLFGG